MKTIVQITLLTFLFLAASPLIPSSAKGQNPPAGYTGPVANRPEIQVGDTWEFSIESQGRPGRRRWEVVEIKPDEILVRSIGILHWNRDLNSFKETNRRGEVVDEVKPETRYYDWPLYCGKSWTVNVQSSGSSGSFSYTDLFEVHCDKGNTLFKVDVPAGIFEAFKITRDVLRGVTHFDAYYAPAAKITIKREGASGTGGENKRVLIRYTPAASAR